MSQFKVEKGIEIPAPNSVGSKLMYPWNDMSVGDSFEIPNCSQYQKNSCKVAGRTYFERHGLKWKVVSDKTEKGERFWVVENEKVDGRNFRM